MTPNEAAAAGGGGGGHWIGVMTDGYSDYSGDKIVAHTQNRYWQCFKLTSPF